MTGGQMQVLLAELNKISRKLDMIDKNSMKERIVNYFDSVSDEQLKKDLRAAGFQEPHPTGDKKPKGETEEPIVLHKSDMVEVEDTDELAREIKARRF